MQEVTAENAADYLRATGRASETEPIAARELPGGVSNVVLLIELPGRGERFVLKQARPRLRVKDEWLCPVERIWTEVEALQLSFDLLNQAELEAPIDAGRPPVLWEDRENYLFAMAAAPVGHRTWKELLLTHDLTDGEQYADACGELLLGPLHANSWGSAEIATQLDDRRYFDQLRLDPYYRQVARQHPDLRGPIEQLIDSVWQNRRCFVHGDFSPKNLLVWPGSMLLIDFEVAHYGDPAFDLGFFLTHLMLKSVWAGPRREAYLAIARRFWNAYQDFVQPRIGDAEMSALEQRTVVNLAGCMLARVDGKSPVEYLTEEHRTQVRQVARRWLIHPPLRLDHAFDEITR